MQRPMVRSIHMCAKQGSVSGWEQRLPALPVQGDWFAYRFSLLLCAYEGTGACHKPPGGLLPAFCCPWDSCLPPAMDGGGQDVLEPSNPC